MRARDLIFHLNCFKCAVCKRQLNTGEEFGIGKEVTNGLGGGGGGLIYCRMHYLFNQQSQQENTVPIGVHHQNYTNIDPNIYYNLDHHTTTSLNDGFLYNNNITSTKLSPTPNSDLPNSQNNSELAANNTTTTPTTKGKSKKRKLQNSDPSNPNGQSKKNTKNKNKNSNNNNSTHENSQKTTLKDSINETTSSQTNQVLPINTDNNNSINLNVNNSSSNNNNNGTLLGSNGEESPEDFNKNFENNLGKTVLIFFYS
jgi:hypothetical protein